MDIAHHIFRTPKELGDILRTRRKSLGITQKDLAMRSGISVPTIIAAEHGKETAQIGVVFALCSDLGLKLGVEI
ncbi:helix-turn-helix transcriptional regulator [Rhodobacteraceae bacterium]|nr:helix-turn-helix transcriptional regulator [Paracoccaceae bacterium]